MRVLGIDPGMGTTGFALLEEAGKTGGGTLVLRQSGEIRLSAKKPKDQDHRLKTLFEKISEIIDRHQPTVVALEDTFFAKNAKSAFTLGQAKGVARLAAEIQNLPVFEYSPKAVKMAVVGFGGATKDQIKEMASRILMLPNRMESEHEADAAAVAICHAHSANWQQKLATSAII